MTNTPCLFCRILANPADPTRICEFPHSVALLNFEQKYYPGYALLILKSHHDHVHDVPRELFHAFIDERAQLAAAIFRAFPQTTRMNYANLGNEVSHVHEHLIPRHANDHNAGAPPWPMEKHPPLPEAEYAAIAAKIRSAFKK